MKEVFDGKDSISFPTLPSFNRLRAFPQVSQPSEF